MARSSLPLGHDPDAMKLPGFVATFVRGAEWPLAEPLRCRCLKS
jgi:hypothetical protein